MLLDDLTVLWQQGEIVQLVRIVIDVVKFGNLIFYIGLNELEAILDDETVPGNGAGLFLDPRNGAAFWSISVSGRWVKPGALRGP